MTDKIEPRTELQMEWLEELVSTSAAALTDEVFDYYTEERGLDYETIAKFRLGVVETLPGHEWLEGWLTIPYLGRNGEPLKVRFRRPPWSESDAKYIDLPGWGPRMFNVRTLHEAVLDSDSIHVTEGEYDAMILEQLGVHAVAIPGVRAWQRYHRRMLAGFSRVHVWEDADAPGRELGDTIVAAMPRSAKKVHLPEAMDVTALYLKEGPDALWDALS